MCKTFLLECESFLCAFSSKARLLKFNRSQFLRCEGQTPETLPQNEQSKQMQWCLPQLVILKPCPGLLSRHPWYGDLSGQLHSLSIFWIASRLPCWLWKHLEGCENVLRRVWVSAWHFVLTGWVRTLAQALMWHCILCRFPLAVWGCCNFDSGRDQGGHSCRCDCLRQRVYIPLPMHPQVRPQRRCSIQYFFIFSPCTPWPTKSHGLRIVLGLNKQIHKDYKGLAFRQGYKGASDCPSLVPGRQESEHAEISRSQLLCIPSKNASQSSS